MDSHWRRAATPIIDRVLRETSGKPEKEIRAALRQAYPFGPTSHHPYKIWLNEIKRQRRGAPALKSLRKAEHAKAIEYLGLQGFGFKDFAPSTLNLNLGE